VFKKCKAIMTVFVVLYFSLAWKLSSSIVFEAKGKPKFTCAQWNPHHNCTQVVTANDTSIRGWDLRTKQYVTFLSSLFYYSWRINAFITLILLPFWCCILS